MVRAKEAKISALVYVAAAIAICFFDVPLEKVGICKGCALGPRLLHPFFHASFLHAIVNGWVLLSLVFIFDTTFIELLLAYVAAVTVPVSLLGITIPTVGASGAIYFLCGYHSWRNRNKWKWHAWWAFFIGIGFFFPASNALLHLWCYAVGVAVGFLNTPLK